MIDGNKSEFRGSSVSNTTSTGKLAFINNLVTVFKVNVDEFREISLINIGNGSKYIREHIVSFTLPQKKL
jgi:hypothetical protein